ncbi:nitrous oxide reductase family maturation protein NosD [Cereibacter johrii]|uniref:right-handed parallel beta-helix repeat-containing protein n=1 Tax=Cereibacter johrii TaxID=445629 RepID=UPI000DCED5E7|nr:right-handed parallel beta-helix repeat-containing protein [Cereibacter johrii]RAZ82562.1 right-handed parallel beta-helix repeat-containing protein [Cereibacter johrii]
MRAALLPLLCALCGAAAAGDCPAPADTAEALRGREVIYLAPDGRDDWSGRFAAPLPDGSDGPVASLTAARDAARELGRPATLALRGGDYRILDPVAFDARDSGLRIVAVPGERPVLHGGPALGDWQEEPGGIWSAPLDPGPGRAVLGLFLDGKRQIPARFPNLPAGATPRDGWLFADRPLPEMELNHQIRIRPADLPAFAHPEGLSVHVVGGLVPGMQWGSDILPVLSVDPRNRILDTGGTGYFFTGEGSRYFLEGVRELLDAPGEWWHDAAAARLLYRPPGTDPAQHRLGAATLATFLEISGAQDLQVTGLEFRDAAILGTGKFGTDMRSYGAIRLARADRARISGNRFENVGVAIHVTESRDVLLSANDIAHAAGNGIYVGTSWGSFGRSDGVRITGNRIRDVGEVFFESAGIWLQASDGFRIEGNLIAGAAQFGISAGSLWGAEDASHDGLIRGNILRDTNRQTADGGAIKLMGAQMDRQRIAVEGNLVTGTDALMNRPDGSFWPPRHEDPADWPGPISWAIYLDERASGNRIAGNLLIGNVTGIGINGGWANEVTGNVIRDGTASAFRIDDATGRAWHPDWAAPNRIEDNTVVTDRAETPMAHVHAPAHGAAFVQIGANRLLAETGAAAPAEPTPPLPPGLAAPGDCPPG